MGRSYRPTRKVKPSQVRVGDAVLVRNPRIPQSTRWLVVDYVGDHAPPYVWSGRWAFGSDVGSWTILNATEERYVVKDRRDAAQDVKRVNRLPRNAHV